MIVGVAIRHPDGRVFQLPRPYRHHHIIRIMAQEDGYKPGFCRDQGFVNGRGIYLDRVNAKIVAENYCQTIRETHPKELFSEDLW